MLKQNMQLNFCFIYVLPMFSFTYVLNVPYFQKQPLHWLNAKLTLRFKYFFCGWYVMKFTDASILTVALNFKPLYRHYQHLPYEKQFQRNIFWGLNFPLKLLLRSISFLLVDMVGNLKPFSKTLISVSIKTFLLRLNKVLEQKCHFSVPLILLVTFLGGFFHF